METPRFNLMRQDIGKLLQTGLIQGKNPRALTKDLKKYWYGNDPLTGKGQVYCMERLMRTELARVQTEAQKQSFIRNGFEEYEFIANSGCCPVCSALDGKHFRAAKMMPGENAPPVHPNCRCSTAAYIDSAEYEEWLDYLDKGGTTVSWNERKKAVENSGNRSTIKEIRANSLKDAVSGGPIREEVADRIYSVLSEHKAAHLFNKTRTEKLGRGVVFQTDAEKVGTFFDTSFVMNEDMLGGKTIKEIDTMFANTSITVANSLDDAVVHEMYHAKLISGLNYAQLDAIYDEMSGIHIHGISQTAESDGAECIAEVGVLIERGERNKIPKEALALFDKYIGG